MQITVTPQIFYIDIPPSLLFGPEKITSVGVEGICSLSAAQTIFYLSRVLKGSTGFDSHLLPLPV